ncbi:hypothetical protein ACQPYK_49580 (plasmid) [Streptosporangium sp. CA-135522]|uniref:hypothetical protein n=1 Tax=Streptosporangium sp. CA-135522 TaxID=3240072 RepID=UPI003D89C95D
MDTDSNLTRDPRYADVIVMYAVMYEDKSDSVEVIAETPELAEKYIAGQWSTEGYSIEQVKVIRALPEPRPLYIITGRLPYNPAKEATRQLDDDPVFPGLGNGTIVPLDHVVGKLSEYTPYGWDVQATGWNLKQTETTFKQRMNEARQLRATRIEEFSGFTHGCVVRTPGGETMLRVVRPDGVPCWKSPTRVLYDADIDPSTLTVIAPGDNPDHPTVSPPTSRGDA